MLIGLLNALTEVIKDVVHEIVCQCVESIQCGLLLELTGQPVFRGFGVLFEILLGGLTTFCPLWLLLLAVKLADEPATKIAQHHTTDTTHHRYADAHTLVGTDTVIILHRLQPDTLQPLLATLFQLGQYQVALHQRQQLNQGEDVLA